MPRLRLLSSVQQVERHLRQALLAGRWRGAMPGVLRLEEELGVNRKTVEGALRLLEREGLLEAQGAGRRRRIAMPESALARRILRVAILLYESADAGLDYIVDLRHRLDEQGHSSFIVPQTLRDLKMDVRRLQGLVKASSADAWVVVGGSRDVLGWFAGQPVPVFALFGRHQGLAIAGIGPDKSAAYAAATRALIELGHRRICMLVHHERRNPEPGVPEKAFLGELVAHGIPTGTYNLPAWEEDVAGLYALLESLFRTTPPTAMIMDGPTLFLAVQQFLLHQGLRVPEHVSVVCTDSDPAFAWCRPSIAHIRWNIRPVVRHVLRWAANISRGKQDVHQSSIQAVFMPGGTIGPV